MNYPFYASVSKGAASTNFHSFGMVRPQDSYPRPPAVKADALPTELSRRSMLLPDNSLLQLSEDYAMFEAHGR